VSRYHSYITSSLQIISNYNGSEPFSIFIKKQFAANKKFGGKDRKTITHLCYCWFRLGHAVKETKEEERMLIALFLCSQTSNELLQFFKPLWNKAIELTVAEKINMLGLTVNEDDLFHFVHELSTEVDAYEFSLSHLTQPNLFLRIRPGEHQTVMHKLQLAGLSFELINHSCLALPNSTKIEQILQLNKEVVVQDYNSQRVGELLQIVNQQTSNAKLNVWDCCAASGGKSIMAYDLLPAIQLTVSDVRTSILANLKTRFAEAGILQYKSFVANLSANHQQKTEQYQLVIADVPCSGSGTWGRTPEQLQFFSVQQIGEYANLQQKIISNIIPSIKQKGYLLYITCSVFQKENEAMVEFIQQQHHLRLLDMKLLNGYDAKADTMFTALLTKEE
jgi:16S rRNA (cytosine967-C5)-methyltransferase